MFGETPEQARQKAGLPSIDYTAWRRGYFGELDAEEAWKHHQTWLQIYPSVEERLRQEYGGADSEPVMDFSGAEIERLTAEGIWQKMQSLPFEEQKRRVRGIRFHSKVFFDLLRKKSREEGRIDRQRGIEVAELALLSLEKCDEIFGEEIHDLRALGWAWLSNAHVLAADFSAAEVAFSESDIAWRASRTQTDQRVLARILNLKGTFRMIQRRHDEGLELVTRSQTIFSQIGDSRGQARALIQSAAIHGYSNRPAQSIDALNEALELIDSEKDHFLAFAAFTNLANTEVRLLRFEAAFSSLTQAKVHCREINNPTGWFEIDWVDADRYEGLGQLKEAKELYEKSRAGFLKAKELCTVALIEIDLAIVHSQLGEWNSAAEHAAKALPVLNARRFGKESAAALKILATGLQSKNSRRSTLRDARNKLHRDPTLRII